MKEFSEKKRGKFMLRNSSGKSILIMWATIGINLLPGDTCDVMTAFDLKTPLEKLQIEDHFCSKYRDLIIKFEPVVEAPVAEEETPKESEEKQTEQKFKKKKK